jgi:glutaredoxin-related protein
MKKITLACSVALVSVSCGSQNERMGVSVDALQAEEAQLAVTRSDGAELTVSTCRANLSSPELCTSTVSWAKAPADSCVFIKGTGQTFACGYLGSAQAPWLRTSSPESVVFVLADRKNPSKVYKEAKAPTAELTVSSCRANVSSPELCTSTVKWASAPADSCVFIKGTGQTFACGYLGSAEAPWLRARTPESVVFVLADRRNPAIVYREARAPAVELTVSACSPNRSSPGLCTSTVNWRNGPSDTCVFIKGTNQTFACGYLGSAQAPWLRTSNPGSVVFVLADRKNPSIVYKEARAPN